ncbi:MAG: hydrogenase small subunit [Planctomycetota bacterium]
MGKRNELSVLWLQGATCTGCSVSVTNVVAPTIRNLLLDEAVPGTHINLRFHATLMAGSGEPVIEVLKETQEKKKGGYVLVVEGAVPTKDDGIYCTVGEENGKEITLLDRVKNLGADALAVLALGTCASYGGIFAGAPNPTGCKGVSQVFKEAGIKTPVLNIPGCPPHPDWFVGTVATVILCGIPTPDAVDEAGRLKAFYGKLIHEHCQRRAYFDAGKFAKVYSDEGCLYELGCKGPQTSADCPIRLWNSGTSWCVECGAGCHGCVEPDYPDRVSPLYRKINEERLNRYKIGTRK